MHFQPSLVYILLLVCGVGHLAYAKRQTPEPWSLFNRNVIYDTPLGQQVQYPRYTELEDGTLLVTCALSGFTPAFFPVFESTDGGASWTWKSNITDQVNGWGLGAQPYLLEMTQSLGGYRKGTILAAGNSENANATGGTRIDLYASKDTGASWEFVSHIAMGGPPNTTNGATPIWEPSLLIYDNELVAFYSDQRDPKHGQKLAHQTSTDMKHWGSVVNDVAYHNYTDRPGMTIVAYVPTVDQWFLVHENPGGLSVGGLAGYPVYYRMADSPLDFRFGQGTPIVPMNTNFSQQPSSSPYIAWTPVGSSYGTMFVSDADHSSIFYNQLGGDPNQWMQVPSPEPMGYSRSLHVFSQFQDRLAIISGGNCCGVDPPDVHSPLSISVVSITKLVAGKYNPGGPDKYPYYPWPPVKGED